VSTPRKPVDTAHEVQRAAAKRQQDKLRELRAWFEAEYARRTAAVERGEVNVDWAIPEYRVSWSEVLAKAGELGIHMSPVDLRLAFKRI
jgi:hypothetical protein